MKKELLSSAARDVVDDAGNPIPVRRINIAALPKIDPEALPGLPDDMEAHLMNDIGQEPMIVLFHPASELHIKVPVSEHENIGPWVEKLNFARLKQAMGEPPEGDAYRV
jgi:hypothetical protein